ncbi:unnamed protein product [Pleuronectes platessa]|uniref:Uncharacterized protein n=1 Tax=Pleuronectes platessa TaxID=8262 RepID=A0A9N7TTM8_PLEPL|nr:unnamed protein product [Pleuronectes platessa]
MQHITVSGVHIELTHKASDARRPEQTLFTSSTRSTGVEQSLPRVMLRTQRKLLLSRLQLFVLLHVTSESDVLNGKTTPPPALQTQADIRPLQTEGSCSGWAQRLPQVDKLQFVRLQLITQLPRLFLRSRVSEGR